MVASKNAGTAWILLVEPSATLRRALQRALATGPYRVVATTSYEAGLHQLKGSGASPPAAVLIGHPAHPTSASNELFAALYQPEYLAVAVMVFAPAASADAFDWVARRTRAALLLWEEYADCLDCIKRLTVSA